MNNFQSMLQVVGRCITLLVQKEPFVFGVTLLIGVILAALCWWAATHYARLFNLTFEITSLHQALCAFAAILTLVFSVIFVSLRFTREVAEEAIETWNQRVLEGSWRSQVYTKVYYAVKATGEEDFSKFPPPVDGNVRIPVNKPETKHLVAALPANDALRLFRRTNPYLSFVLSLPDHMPEALIVNDLSAFFSRNPGGTYPLERSAQLTAAEIKSRLDPETPKAVLYARLILTAGFLLAQGIPFLWIGYAAYRDLKVGV